MKTKNVLSALTLTLGLACAGPVAAQTNGWTCDVTLYGLAVGMSGDAMVRGIPADVDVGFNDIWDNLEFGAMGSVRVGHGPWALTTDVIYMNLGASKQGFSVDFEQWVVEPTLSYRLCQNLEVLAGVRYNRVDAEITGPLGINPSGSQSWWDPIVGANVSLPLGEKFCFNMRGDIGGFDVGSDLTWQAFPSVSWQFAKAWSLNAGYRWVYTDYSTGSGANEFQYDVLSQGPQLGVTFRF